MTRAQHRVEPTFTLEHHTKAFLTLLFPAIHGQIDWRQPIELLDKELQQLQFVAVWPFLESIAWVSMEQDLTLWPLENNQSAHRLPIGLGEVKDSGRARIALGKTRKDSRRFMTARLIADGIYAGETGNWLPCTNAATVRQKFQRAFAQEFLCPYNDLIEWMDTTSPDEETMEAAAEHFEVSPLMVNTVMVNRGHIPPSELDAFQQAV